MYNSRKQFKGCREQAEPKITVKSLVDILYIFDLTRWGEKSQKNGIESKKDVINNMNCYSGKGVYFSTQFTILHPIFFGILELYGHSPVFLEKEHWKNLI